MIRSWGLVPLGGTAQPAFGDVTAAAVGFPLGNGIIPVIVASTVRYRVGDRIYLEPGTVNQDMLLIEEIFSGTVLYCASEGDAKTHTHASGALIQLSIPCATVNIQPLSDNADPLYVGADSTITAAPTGALYQQILPTSPPSSDFSIGYNILRTSDFWMVSTGGSAIVACIVA